MYLSAIYIVQDKVELLYSLKRVVKPNQKRVFEALQQHVSLCHDVLLLKREKEKNKFWEVQFFAFFSFFV